MINYSDFQIYQNKEWKCYVCNSSTIDGLDFYKCVRCGLMTCTECDDPNYDYMNKPEICTICLREGL